MRERMGARRREERLSRRAELLGLSRVSMRDASAVKRLIEQGMSQGGLDELLERAWKMNGSGEAGLAVARLALAAGANPNGAPWRGRPMLEDSLLMSKWGFAAELASRGGDPGPMSDGQTPLAMAAGRGAPEEALAALISQGFCVQGSDSTTSPLLSAWSAGQMDSMKALLRLGANAKKALDEQEQRRRRMYVGVRNDAEGRELLRVAVEREELGRVGEESGAIRRGPKAL